MSPVLYLRAAWVYAGTDGPLRDGAILVGPTGRIEWVGPAADRPPPDQALALRFDTGVALPGFVNTHTHLELTHLEGLVAQTSFPQWLLAVRRLKDATTAEEFDAAARLGVLDMWAQGVTTVADTGSTGAVARALDSLGGRGVVYQEVFGPDPADADQLVTALAEAVASLEPHASERVRLGVSPHAPYTVSEALMGATFALAEGKE